MWSVIAYCNNEGKKAEDMSKWLKTECSSCSEEIAYLAEWNRVPDLCKGCREERKAARAKWHEKSCGCGNVIKYHQDWDRIPDLCKECVAQKKAERTKWREKPCPCGGTVKYHEDWSNPPTRCRECEAPLTKPCAARDCSETIRYKRWWDRIPQYCRACKSGERKVAHRQEKGDGTVHEYEGRGYVNRQGVAVFKDDGSSGRHSHAVHRPDGSLKGRREEGWGEQFVNGFVGDTLNTKVHRGRDVVRHDRLEYPYKDRQTDRHAHQFAKAEARETGLRGHFKVVPVEGAAGEYSPRTRRKR